MRVCARVRVRVTVVYYESRSVYQKRRHAWLSMGALRLLSR